MANCRPDRDPCPPKTDPQAVSHARGCLEKTGDAYLKGRDSTQLQYRPERCRVRDPGTPPCPYNPPRAPRKHDLWLVLNAILYILRGGEPWPCCHTSSRRGKACMIILDDGARRGRGGRSTMPCAPEPEC
jgi:hypothetical protein